MVSSIINAIVGGNSSSKAASQEAAANNAAASGTNAQYQATAADIAAQKAQNQANLQPYLNTGTSANNTLGYLLGLGGVDASNGMDGAAGSLAKPFTMADYEADPGYAFRLQQGQAALDRANSAGGKYFSGAAIKGLTDYNQNSASQEYQNAYNRYNTNQSNLYSKLSGTALTGQNAANTLASTDDALTLGQGQLGAGAATQAGQDVIGAGQAQAAGTLGKGAAWTTGISSIGNGAGNLVSAFI